MEITRTEPKIRLAKIFFVTGLACAILALPVIRFTWATERQISDWNVVTFRQNGPQSDKQRYLSDLEYMPVSRVGWGSIINDQATGGGKISLNVEGAARTFEKGVFAHAASDLRYDLRAVQGYDYFTTYYGINRTAGAPGSVKFYIYTSEDAETWTLVTEENPAVKRTGENASRVKIPIQGVNYLRLVADSDGSNASDHAVWADAKLIKNSYQEYSVPAAALVENLDNELKTRYASSTIEESPDFEATILRRELMKNFGIYNTTQFIEASADNVATLNWIYNDLTVLRLYVTGGKPTGSYYNSLAVLGQLYRAYRGDFEDGAHLANASGTRGELYRKMVISLSLTHSKQVRFWVRDQGPIAGSPDSPQLSRPLDRYLVYKRMYLAGKLNGIFETLEIEEMRNVMATEMGDDEIEWFNDYLRWKNLSPYSYPPMPYVSIGNHYWYDSNFAEENQAKWKEKYKLVGDNYDANNRDKTIAGNYFIDFTRNAPRIWTVLEHGGVCWQISNIGQNMVSSYGIPSTTLGQPGHVAFANYEVRDGKGTGVWLLTNDVFGWPKTNFTGYTNIETYHNVRQLNNWGATDGSYNALINRYGYQGSYISMSQAALNEFDNYAESQEMRMLADVYGGDAVKQEAILRTALAKQTINFDAWYGLVKNYVEKYGVADDAEKAQKYYDLAAQIVEDMYLFPVPMYDLLQTLIAKVPITNDAVIGYNSALQILLTNKLKEGSVAEYKTYGEGKTYKYSMDNRSAVTRIMASALLGTLNNETAKFSFDGDAETKNVLKLGAKYEASSAAWEYSLDGGATWSVDSVGWISDNAVKLTDAQIRSITATNDIKVHIQGTPRTDANIYIIDIVEQGKPDGLYANDWENRVIGSSTAMEWRIVKNGDAERDESGAWTSYQTASPDLTGEKIVQLRMAATGTKLASPASNDYVFHTDPNDFGGKRKYVTVAHYTVAAFSSQAAEGWAGGKVTNAIDGNANTRWHSNWYGGDTKRYITIKFDYDMWLSAFEYMAVGGGNGNIAAGTLEVSMDGENFTKVGEWSGWPTASGALSAYNIGKTVDGTFVFEPVQARYARITRTDSPANQFVAAKMLNFYEDATVNPRPTAGVWFSTTEPVSGEVVARVVNPSKPITITNNDGKDTYVFRNNGEFTFEFKDETDQAGSVTARVNWISNSAPVGRIVYGCVKDSDSNFEGAGADEHDCSGSQIVNHSVTAKLVFDPGVNVTILNNGPRIEQNNDPETAASHDPFTYLFMENGEFVFEYVDEAGNRGNAYARVDWIDKTKDTITPEPTMPDAPVNPDTTKRPTTTTTTTTKRPNGGVVGNMNNGGNSGTGGTPTGSVDDDGETSEPAGSKDEDETTKKPTGQKTPEATKPKPATAMQKDERNNFGNLWIWVLGGVMVVAMIVVAGGAVVNRRR